jgi:hypothetical protein
MAVMVQRKTRPLGDRKGLIGAITCRLWRSRVTREDDVRWLSCLVWPGEGDRAQRLAAAIASARRDPPVVHRGDMLTGLPSLVANAPADATLVIYHTSALWYLPAERREQFAATVRGLGAIWLASEPPGVVPGTEGPARDGHTCVLARDGHVIALTESHGTWLQWLP